MFASWRDWSREKVPVSGKLALILSNVFSISLTFPLYQGTKQPISPQCRYLSSQFLNCMKKAVTFVRSCWELGFKNPKTILLNDSLDLTLFPNKIDPLFRFMKSSDKDLRYLSIFCTE